jgi:hypothetical protein
MLEFIRTLWQLCKLQKGPQDLPYSNRWLGLVLGINYAFLVIFIARSQGLGNALWSSFVLMGIPLASVYLVLRWRRMQNRVTQTLTALFAANILLSLITATLLLLTMSFAATGSVAVMQGMAKLVGFIMVIWTLTVAGHIFRSALSVTLLWGVMFAVALEIVKAVMFRLLVGG